VKQSNTNLEASWLPTVTQLVDQSSSVQEPVIESECFMYCLKRIQNGQHLGQLASSVKRFPALHNCLLTHYNSMLLRFHVGSQRDGLF